MRVALLLIGGGDLRYDDCGCLAIDDDGGRALPEKAGCRRFRVRFSHSLGKASGREGS